MTWPERLLPGGRVAVLDCVFTHAAAASYDQYASQEAGSAAALAETRKVQTLERFVDGTSYKFVPLAVESFGWLKKLAAHFLNDLGGVAAADGCTLNAVFVWISSEAELRFVPG